jgi:hypothetical protein
MSLVLNEENKAALLDKVYIVWLGDTEVHPNYLLLEDAVTVGKRINLTDVCITNETLDTEWTVEEAEMWCKLLLH